MSLENPLSPYLTVADAAAAIAFYEEVFGAVRDGPYLTGPSGVVMHAEVRIGGGALMLAEAEGPPALDDPPMRLALMVEDVDAVMSAAEARGAEILIPAADQFYGHRSGRLRDPFGHVWVISKQIENVAPEEMQKRLDALFSGG